jgi:dihydroorotate dehydrogenase
MYRIIRPFLFCLDPETAHHVTLSALRYLPSGSFAKPQGRVVDAMGLKFAHPIGLAAGLDKNGDYLDALAKLGFSFIELGTVTPRPQIGNPKPRLFRLPAANALINRMGFNNHGVDALVENVKKARYQGILGINIGKNKDTSLDGAVDDYLYCLRKVYLYASYITVNISSPNTPDLRQLQQGAYFHTLMKELREEQLSLSDLHQRYVPLVVKVSPDETDDTLKQIADVIVSQGIDGIIATNTTCARDAVSTLPHGNEQGGLSGRPLTAASTHCLTVLKQVVGDDVTLIGVGGIDSSIVAKEKLEAGASLLQVYTGLIYQGPGLVRALCDGL